MIGSGMGCENQPDPGQWENKSSILLSLGSFQAP
jgi:hypothetical protein